MVEKNNQIGIVKYKKEPKSFFKKFPTVKINFLFNFVSLLNFKIANKLNKKINNLKFFFRFGHLILYEANLIWI